MLFYRCEVIRITNEERFRKGKKQEKMRELSQWFNLVSASTLASLGYHFYFISRKMYSSLLLNQISGISNTLERISEQVDIHFRSRIPDQQITGWMVGFQRLKVFLDSVTLPWLT